MFVKNFFNRFNFLRICIILVPNNTHIVHNDPKICLNSFFGYEYPKYAEFHADFKSVEIIEKSAHRKSYLPKLLQISSIEEENPQFCTLFSPVTFLLANF